VNLAAVQGITVFSRCIFFTEAALQRLHLAETPEVPYTQPHGNNRGRSGRVAWSQWPRTSAADSPSPSTRRPLSPAGAPSRRQRIRSPSPPTVAVAPSRIYPTRSVPGRRSTPRPGRIPHPDQLHPRQSIPHSRQFVSQGCQTDPVARPTVHRHGHFRQDRLFIAVFRLRQIAAIISRLRPLFEAAQNPRQHHLVSFDIALRTWCEFLDEFDILLNNCPF
jgi:hypothetical protein